MQTAPNDVAFLATLDATLVTLEGHHVFALSRTLYSPLECPRIFPYFKGFWGSRFGKFQNGMPVNLFLARDPLALQRKVLLGINFLGSGLPRSQLTDQFKFFFWLVFGLIWT